jgi:prepilin-type N-terminal cleavage/methylation domain-containing protein
MRNTWKKCRTGSRGFTLIEVIVTVVILTLGLLTIMGVFLGAAKANSHAQKMDIAHYIAQQTIEQFRNTRFIQIQPFTENYGDITDYPNHRREVKVTVAGSLKMVQVLVHFDNDLHNAEISTCFADL